jgi:hypothetical protein
VGRRKEGPHPQTLATGGCFAELLLEIALLSLPLGSSHPLLGSGVQHTHDTQEKRREENEGVLLATQ